MSKCDNCIHVGVCHYIMFGDSDEITECRHFNEERPKGRWILEEADYDDGGNNLYRCNICHHSDTHSGSIEVPYCWHCGADMREADNE